ncbi:2461_t:CDS:2, partial [Scutellospora calospora]
PTIPQPHASKNGVYWQENRVHWRQRKGWSSCHPRTDQARPQGEQRSAINKPRATLMRIHQGAESRLGQVFDALTTHYDFAGYETGKPEGPPDVDTLDTDLPTLGHPLCSLRQEYAGPRQRMLQRQRYCHLQRDRSCLQARRQKDHHGVQRDNLRSLLQRGRHRLPLVPAGRGLRCRPHGLIRPQQNLRRKDRPRLRKAFRKRHLRAARRQRHVRSCYSEVWSWVPDLQRYQQLHHDEGADQTVLAGGRAEYACSTTSLDVSGVPVKEKQVTMALWEHSHSWPGELRSLSGDK